jgi:hypothetical protein
MKQFPLEISWDISFKKKNFPSLTQIRQGPCGSESKILHKSLTVPAQKDVVIFKVTASRVFLDWKNIYIKL